MSDSLTPEKRSWNMSRIRGKDTSIELKVRKHLFSQGFRYRKNVSSLPGKPDIVLAKYHVVIFLHGCFWHRHDGCKRATTPKSRSEYWLPKFEHNVKNDKQHYADLIALGWKVIVVWECSLNSKKCEKTLELLNTTIKTMTDNLVFI